MSFDQLFTIFSAMLNEYNIDSFVGLQLVCCLAWEDETRRGFDAYKYAFFLTRLKPEIAALAKAKMDRLHHEVETYDLADLIEEYTTLMPNEHRIEVLRACQAIIGSQEEVPDVDQKLIDLIERKLH